MIIVGPRVIKRISDDYSEFSILAKESKNGVPFRAILLQTVIAGLLILTSSLSFIITSIGFILSVFTTLTAVALIYLRYKHPQAERKIKVPFYPITPLLFIVFNLWTMAYLIINKPEEALTGVGFVLAGLLFYFIIKNTQSMKKKGISAMLLIVSFISCTSNENGETKNNTVSDTASIAKTDSNSVRFNANPELDKRAAQIAGMDTGWIKANETKKAVSKLDNSWKEKKTAILNPIRTWVENNQYYPTAIQQQCLVFYPFSGPDFEFVNAFYPEADTYILCGLEKAGNDQSLLFSKETALDSFIKMAENYFYFSDKMGFFRTIDMKQQFARRGVVDIIALYIKRAGAEIGEVSLSVWDKNTGELVPPTAGSVPDVCSFVFRYPSGNVSTLHYFSKDLSDGGLQQDARWLPWVTKQASGRPIVSLTKSASYLMHTSEFSQVRSYILQNSITHIQDDTGISYDDMLKTGKKVILHGEYTTVIPVFKHYYQKTMAERYRSDSVQRLPFKIGYNLSHSEASLQVLQK